MTNWREVGAFSLTQAIVIAASAMLSGIVLAPIYTALVHAHKFVWIMPVGIVYSAAMWALALPLFLVLRALFAGVPAVVAGAGRERAFITVAAELGAYFLAFVIERILFVLAGPVGLTSIYVALRSAGHAELIRAVAVAISIVFAAIFFLVFIGLRLAMRGSAAAVSAKPT